MKLKQYILVYICLLLCLLPFFSNAQLTNNRQTIALSNGAVIMVKGNLNNSGTFSNNGTLTVEGDWSNTGTYNEQTGVVNLRSNVDQQVAHGDQAFYILNFEGTGEKFISEPISIVNTLTLTNNLASMRANGSILIRSTGTINGISSTAYINGLLFHEGTGQKFFPIGKNGNYLPVTLENVSGNNPVVGLEAFEPNSNTNLSDEVEEVSTLRYWELTAPSGTFDGSLITLPVQGDESIVDSADPNTLLVVEADDINAPFRSLGQSTRDLSSDFRTLTSFANASGGLITIGIEPSETFFIPNAFSPQAMDSEDQVIKVYGNAIADENFTFRVYNKWGSLIFESADRDTMQNQGWTGVDQSSGEELPSGAYTYVLKGQFSNGKSFSKTGSVTLIK